MELNLPNFNGPEGDASIASLHLWEERLKPELLESFAEHMYGKIPDDSGPIHFEVLESDMALEGRATRKRIKLSFWGVFGSFSFNVILFTPNKPEKPVPTFLYLNYHDWEDIDPDRISRPAEWPVELFLDRGYALAAITLTEISPDVAPEPELKQENFKTGLIGALYGKAPLPNHGARSIAAWAWGARKALDYLESDRRVDKHRLAVTGHSRAGKAALWCGAQDERVALTVSLQSGCSGASLARYPGGESLAALNTAFPHWFCENYQRYNFDVKSLPFDQHQLLSLVAPRLLYIASAQQDEWAGPEGEFLATRAAGSVYEWYGKSGISGTYPPEVNQPLHSGEIGYHLRSGEHEVRLEDWEMVLDFAAKHWKT